MAESKKFGTFAGVFTPSILTILGVIMYMRLGWVVGNAGLAGSLIIIGIAHIISLTTGLSISSIATDKKVGAGGVYYVLSRSLGLPVGGAIGMTLFVGTALSIALYLVGFAESFNAYLGLDTTINGLRITGSIALFLLAAIALISTAVALKAQFFIMAGIIISLISIFLGSAEFAPQTISFFGLEGGASMEQVFAIFFPAVTGFTAGIAMSGDLQDPKKSIPAGTIASIVVGFVVYVILAIFISYMVNSDALVSDTNILMRIALFAPGVVAGIWGATLSSALGGILGGPRILQAMSLDSITPAIFAKGRGKDKEPWNALFLTFIIAQGGILIGELDMIARVVSMFYLAAYGFINISFFLESWASSDFNPTFKVKRWVGLVGFVATFAVMFKLDMLAMIAAFVIIGGIYLWLQRKSISLGTGDIWLSVWNTLVKRGLRKLEAQDDHIRNWKPNVLLFSGGSAHRPHLLEFSLSLAGKAGMITNFDLVENSSAKLLFPKHKQVVKDQLLERYGIFGRRIEVQNVFKGIENIASTFGFSGIEPNTVLMGWAKNTSDPVWFAQMTQRLIDLDYNVLYLDYDDRFGFRQYKRIDIWWRSISNNAELTLSISKFLLGSDKWRNAEVRILMVNNTLQEGFERKIYQKLDEYRIPATVKVFNNAIEQKSFYDIMKATSADSDLIVAGIPMIATGEEKSFVDNTSNLFGIVGTTLLVKASDKLGGDASAYKQNKVVSELQLKRLTDFDADLAHPADVGLADATIKFHKSLTEISEQLAAKQLTSIRNNYSSLVNTAEMLLLSKVKELTAEGKKPSSNEIKKEQVELLFNFHKKLQEFCKEDLPYLAERLNSMSEVWIERLAKLSTNQPATITRVLTKQDVVYSETDTKKERRTKRFLNFKFKIGISPKIKVPFKTVAHYHTHSAGIENFFKFQHKIGVSTLNVQLDLRQRFIETVQLIDAIGTEKEIDNETLLKGLRGTQVLIDKQFNHLYNYLIQNSNHLSKLVIESSAALSIEDLGIEMTNKNLNLAAKKAELTTYYEHWLRNQTSFTLQAALDISLRDVSYTIKQIGHRIKSKVAAPTFEKAALHLAKAEKAFLKAEKLFKASKFEQAAEINFDIDDFFQYDDIVVNRVLDDLDKLVEKLPEQIEVLDEDSMNYFATSQREGVRTFTIDLQHIAEYLIDTGLKRPIEQQLQAIPQECRHALSYAIQGLRLLSFGLSAHVDKEAHRESLAETFDKAKEGLAASKKALSARKVYATDLVDDIILTANSNLNASYIIEQAEQLKSASRKSTNVGVIVGFWKRIQQYGNRYLYRYSRLINAKREDLLYAEFLNENSKHENVNAKLRSFVEQVTPSKSVLAKVPFYYQQMFVGKHSLKAENLKNREREMREVSNAIYRLQNGANGGILVIGESLSGKSFFSEIVAKRGNRGKIYKINPPITGSTKAKDVLRVFQSQIGASTSAEEIILSAPEGSVFILNHIELWWERSLSGGAALRQIVQLIKQYSDRYLFVVNCNLFAFKLMQHQEGFQDHFIATIQLSPFGNRSIADTLMERHRTGGLEFQLDGVSEHQLSDKKLRKLFDEYIKTSNGNIGVAMHQWIANIRSVKHGKLSIQLPKANKMPTINDPDKLVLLAQFVIHKHLTVNKVKRIYALKTRAEALLMIQNLERTGLVEELMGETYRIPPYLVGFIAKSLKGYKLV